ncbi:MAG TPA: PadR family transcriptional regulator [Mobilitalea sp.]|nr:PadR family transcriptional regulator [Mobilitalea sp.]
MNKLSYGLLSLLSTEPMTGYDLTLKINLFWRSTHSAIYPLLSELEEEGIIELTLIKQNGKPDKKLYHLTKKGEELLYQWVTSETSDAVVRDEMTLKLYCLKCMNMDAADKLLGELETKYKRKVEKYRNAIDKLKSRSEEYSEDIPPSLFGAYILTQKALNEALLGQKWCEWVRDLYAKKDISFLTEDFN